MVFSRHARHTQARNRPVSRSSHLNAIIAVLVSTLFFAIQDAFTKQLSVSLPAWQIVCIRFFFFSLFAVAWATRSIGLRAAFRTGNLPLQLIRGILIVSEIALFAFTIAYLGLAEMHAIFACFPLIITALSGPMLKERVGWRRWLAVLAGFIGTLIILKPGTGVFNPYALLAVACALGLSIYTILTRRLSSTDSFETSLLYFGVAGFGFSLLFAPFVWEPVSQDQWGILLMLSLSAIIGHFCLIMALQLAPAVLLQPFNYFVLVWAMIIGYLAFGEVLDSTTLVGTAIVVGSGLFIARREYRLSRSPRDVPDSGESG